MVIVGDRNVPAPWPSVRCLTARRLAAALFVFFAAAAGAGVVPSDLDGGSHRFGLGYGFGGFADHVLCLVGGAAFLGGALARAHGLRVPFLVTAAAMLAVVIIIAVFVGQGKDCPQITRMNADGRGSD